MQALSRISRKALSIIRESITEAGGNEVMFCGTVNTDGIIDSIITAARGNEESVPAIEAFIDKGDVVIHNHPDGHLKPSSADIRIASILGSQGTGFIIIDNQAENIYVVAEPLVTKRKNPVDISGLSGKLAPGGRMSEVFKDYEPRGPQIEMLAFAAEAFNRSWMAVAEAGTGVGKSLAYLLPSFQWVMNNDERVVISTNTINLQHQLLEKDIPIARKILETDKKACLIKGRSNYLCYRKYFDVLNENSLFRSAEDEDSDSKNAQFNIIREWVSVTETGDKADLPLLRDYSVWNEVCSESDYCLGLYCSYREKCFVISARKKAASASVLVVNHHLLFSDLSARSSGAGFNGTAVLPMFRHVIFDEAHNIESSATSYFSMNLTKGFLIKNFRRIYGKSRNRIFGIYRFLAENNAKGSAKTAEIPSLINQALENYDAMEKEALMLLGSRQSVRIERKTEFDNLFSFFSAFRKKIMELYSAIDESSAGIDISADEDSRVYELVLIKSRLKELVSTAEILVDCDDNYVSWIEKGKNVSFTLTPLDVSKVLRETVYSNLKTIFFTSATLSIKKSFDFWKKRIGLFDFDRTISEKIFESPFDYGKRVMLAVPQDISDPSLPLYAEELAEFVKKIVILSEGGVLLLFTSYSMLLDVFERIKDPVSSCGINILRQGEFDRYKLQKIFNQDKKSILLATDSFWEGIDSPGETLKIVIICRLPFRVPTDPVTRSRLEKIEREGGNPFFDYSLPEAVLKLKQGFGRLMRRKTDRGIVIDRKSVV